jgi:hypothetical protein
MHPLFGKADKLSFAAIGGRNRGILTEGNEGNEDLN